jgi:lipid-binding SYLF domain-containing protein|tara:strand:+ start:12358 stop:13071 length:714 start_codon:yes stop_codon:yes gene_type:complete
MNINGLISTFETRVSMEGILKQSRQSLEEYINPALIKVDEQIPKQILKDAKGIVILTIVKTGLIINGSVGTGIILIKQDNQSQDNESQDNQSQEGQQWSGPSAVGMCGLSIGLQLGLEKVDVIIVLNTDDAVQQFMKSNQVTLGGEASISVGPVGRDAEVALGLTTRGVEPMYSYSKSKGLYAGLSVEGKILMLREACNYKFYNQIIPVRQILSNNNVQIPPNEDLTRIYEILNTHC